MYGQTYRLTLSRGRVGGACRLGRAQQRQTTGPRRRAGRGFGVDGWALRRGSPPPARGLPFQRAGRKNSNRDPGPNLALRVLRSRVRLAPQPEAHGPRAGHWQAALVLAVPELSACDSTRIRKRIFSGLVAFKIEADSDASSVVKALSNGKVGPRQRTLPTSSPNVDVPRPPPPHLTLGVVGTTEYSEQNHNPKEKNSN
jgi:hypothetical protein